MRGKKKVNVFRPTLPHQHRLAFTVLFAHTYVQVFTIEIYFFAILPDASNARFHARYIWPRQVESRPIPDAEMIFRYATLNIFTALNSYS